MKPRQLSSTPGSAAACPCIVIERVCGIWLLTAQKPINSQVGGKESLLYFRCQQLREKGRHLFNANSPQLTTSGAKGFIDRMRGPYAGTAQSALTGIFKLVISGLTRFILIVLGTVNL